MYDIHIKSHRTIIRTRSRANDKARYVAAIARHAKLLRGMGALPPNTAATGVELIARERERQINEKGWTAAHDDGHTDQSIANAAGWIINDCLLAATHEADAEEDDPDATWPEKLAVHVREKYGDDLVRRLTIAGALIAAEIDRLQRLK